MRILLTNDDGYDAPGLAALYQAARLLGIDQIDVVAPAVMHSGKGHTVSDKVRCRREMLDDIGQVIAVEGTPADCVRAALALPGRQRPDWVIAGINRGGNLGVDVYYSGTVAASREAVIHGVPAIALSQVVRRPREVNWNRSATTAAAVLANLILPGKPIPDTLDAPLHATVAQALRDPEYAGLDDRQPPFWNVNLPHPAEGEVIDQARVVRISTDPLTTKFRHTTDDDGCEYLEDVGDYHQRPFDDGTDVSVAFSGAISISPLIL